ncbi:MAG: hypothetical protein ACI8SC_000936 [Colwellia sp.]|jgi:hypothetical protein
MLVACNTMLGSDKLDLATATSQGLGIGLYAAIAVTGIGVVIAKSPLILNFSIHRFSPFYFI